MVREIMRDEAFLAKKAEPASPEDLPVAQDLLEGQALEVHQGAVPEREIPDPLQDLHRLDSPDHPARDRPLRGDFDLSRETAFLNRAWGDVAVGGAVSA